MGNTKRNITAVLAAVGVVAVCACLLFFGGRFYLKIAYPLKYESLVNTNAASFEVPPSLIFAVIHTESHFDSQAVSPVGAKGLMQLMDETYEWIQTKLPEEPAPISRIFEPEINIRCGTKVLQVLLSQFDTLETALAAYNAGSGNVSRWLKNPEYSDDGVTLTVIPLTETKEYVSRVLKAQKRYQALYKIV